MRWLDGISGVTGHELEQTLEGSEEQRLEYCRPWGRKESDLTQPPNNNNTVQVTSSEASQCLLLPFPLSITAQNSVENKPHGKSQESKQTSTPISACQRLLETTMNAVSQERQCSRHSGTLIVGD